VAGPETQFARAGDVNVAYQVVGDGPVDLVLTWGLATNVELIWEEPTYAAFVRRLGEFARVFVYDRRGCGVSDREGTTVTPTLEERAEDVLAVLDDAGSERASIFGVSEGGALAAMLAATYPERIASIVIYSTMARFLRDEEHPWGLWEQGELLDSFARMRDTWGTEEGAAFRIPRWAPSMVGDERFARWFTRNMRQSVSRAAIGPLMFSTVNVYDLVEVYPTVHVPTLVVHRRDDVLIPISHGRRIAEQIPGARFVELPGRDHLPYCGDVEPLLTEIEDFLVGSRATSLGDRRLLTLAFTDVIDTATETVEISDPVRRELLASHDQAVRDHLARFGGTEVKQRGEGFLATFDGPARAIRCVLDITAAAERIGLPIRAGVHTGECEVIDGDVHGIAVHIGARLVELAAPGQILVSSAVRDLVAGSGIRFGDGTPVELEGLAGHREVFPVLSHGAAPDVVRRYAIEHANVLRCDGDYWTAAFEGLVVTVRDSKGLRDLARLLSTPNRELHVLDLAAEAGATLEQGDTGPILDDTAKTQYRRRLDDIETELADAELAGDDERAARAGLERDALVDELSAAYGLGGRPRRPPEHVERARKTVTRRIRDAISRIETIHPLLGRHLDASVRTGVFCSYAPERDVVWTIDPSS
jgi:pimeloyl-ACP methyl ester carboxylesterase